MGTVDTVENIIGWVLGALIIIIIVYTIYKVTHRHGKKENKQ